MDIYIRDISAEIKTKLEEQSRQKGMSLNAYCKVILEDYALNPAIRSIDDKYKYFVETLAGAYKNELDKNTEAILENTHLLRKIESVILNEDK